MPKLRIVFVVLTAGLFSSSPAVVGERGARLPQEAYLAVKARDLRFLIPFEHVPGEVHPLAVAPETGMDADDGQIHVVFSAAWLAAHVDGYQPILNDRFESQSVLVVVEQAGGPRNPLVIAGARELWYGTGFHAGRQVTGEIEPHTGMHIIRPPPATDGTRHWRIFLAETPPLEGTPYPESPPWSPLVCSHEASPLDRHYSPGLEPFTQCLINRRASDRILFQTRVADENLEIRERMFEAMTTEILRWQALGAARARDGQR